MGMTILFYGLTLATVLLARWIRGEWKWGYLFGGLCFGVYNEFLFEFCWDYSPVLGPFLWRDVPLVVVLGWGTIGLLAMSGSDRLQARLGAKISSVRRFPVAWLLVFDVAIYFVLGITEELAMSRSGYWKYNFPIQGTLAFQMLGYLGVSLQVSSLGRRLEKVRETVD